MPRNQFHIELVNLTSQIGDYTVCGARKAAE